MEGAQLILFTTGHRITGQIATGRQRLSDLLNNPSTTILDLHDAVYQEMLTEREPESVPRLSVRKDEVIVAIPMDGPNLAARIQTQTFLMEMGTAFFTAVGNLHRRPSDPTNISTLIGGFNRIFVPLSNADLRYLPNGKFDTTASVILLDTRKVQFWAMDPASAAKLRSF